MTDRSGSVGATSSRNLNWYVAKAQSEAACLAPTCKLALGVAKLEMPDGGLAEHMLDHFRSGDASAVKIDIDRELERNPRLREFLTDLIETEIFERICDGEDVEDMNGAVWVRQSDYGLSEAGRDQQLALGGTYFEYRVVGTGDDGSLLIQLYVSDHYLWSPGEDRPTQCLHACGAEMVLKGEATEFHQFGEGSLIVGDPRSTLLMDRLPPEVPERR